MDKAIAWSRKRFFFVIPEKQMIQMGVQFVNVLIIWSYN